MFCQQGDSHVNRATTRMLTSLATIFVFINVFMCLKFMISIGLKFARLYTRTVDESPLTD